MANAASSSLRAVVALTNHGNRAPSDAAPILCPKNAANFDKYGVPFMQLTDAGMRQMYAAGQHTRSVYVDSAHFLSPTFKQKRHFETYFRADAAMSCGQSATTFGYGLYPSVNSNLPFPNPIPIVMQLASNEFEFGVTDGPCAETLSADLAAYSATRGKALLKAHAPLVQSLSKVCGTDLSGTDTITSLNVLADMSKLDRLEGLPPTLGLTDPMYQELQELALTQRMERFLGTPRQVTYYMGGFPAMLLANLAPVSPSSPYKFYAYTGHRELLHGMGLLLDWRFEMPGEARAPGFNTTALPPATTMYFELHEENGRQLVRTFLWSPLTGRAPVQLGKCSALDCPMDEFRGILDAHVAATSSWETLCAYHPVKKVKNMHFGSDPVEDSLTSLIMCAALVLCTVFAMHSAYRRIHQFKRRDYTPI
ncbi:hypothetical protein SDRG_09550 [Saprolegnia diclina VS20]|uniref:Acid phosphatase n=1 Tax=Saprolegnia diclina (strain VS20) TaxID=1156394 RepID=T0QHB5_SAPDV|nr:hypothetical protein SDRG_09550 [Saprolegnia diclina VS20]EQC33030.1 hypothetical protein SDRG_09550 [Saprolegnia diclina VS20]|eukprot:XP_008613716.1 hypothetical protein SDRG_09550 [Saprolegnia diclina VS20]